MALGKADWNQAINSVPKFQEKHGSQHHCCQMGIASVFCQKVI